MNLVIQIRNEKILNKINHLNLLKKRAQAAIILIVKAEVLKRNQALRVNRNLKLNQI